MMTYGYVLFNMKFSPHQMLQSAKAGNNLFGYFMKLADIFLKFVIHYYE